jgi:hypothetical protein
MEKNGTFSTRITYDYILTRCCCRSILLFFRPNTIIICPTVDTSIFYATDWQHLNIDMATNINRQSKDFLCNNQTCCFKRIFQCQLLARQRYSSVIADRKMPFVLSTILVEYQSRSNDVWSSLCAITIIIFCLTWIFKKNTYVKVTTNEVERILCDSQ